MRGGKTSVEQKVYRRINTSWNVRSLKDTDRVWELERRGQISGKNTGSNESEGQGHLHNEGMSLPTEVERRQHSLMENV